MSKLASLCLLVTKGELLHIETTCREETGQELKVYATLIEDLLTRTSKSNHQ